MSQTTARETGDGWMRRALADPGGRAVQDDPPSPPQVAQALRENQARARQLADIARAPGAGEAQLAAYEEALDQCSRLVLLSLELAKRHGPAYLALPGDAT